MRIAVIVTTYNRPDALTAVLDGYRSQRDRDFELIAADDGSNEETRHVIEDCRRRGDLRLNHVWQEDRGFRAAAIRNRAVASTSADYIIFSDGDCIPRPEFVSQHRRIAERGWFVAGNRILLSEGFTEEVLTKSMPIHTWNLFHWFLAFLRKDINRWWPMVPLRFDSPLRKMTASVWRGVMTCNLSVWRDDLVRINGLDEEYVGWGLEDSDLVIRLIRSGVRHKTGRFAAPVLHLWHRDNDRVGFTRNQDRLDSLLRSDRVKALQGVSQYSATAADATGSMKQEE
ncbi:MAG: glycosyltransferase family 2 protein [Deltaproteobacteria bacterium]|nr:glycosyltransferase family 2 protein [Deltaproteobacteria bacterium]